MKRSMRYAIDVFGQYDRALTEAIDERIRKIDELSDRAKEQRAELDRLFSSREFVRTQIACAFVPATERRAPVVPAAQCSAYLH